MKKTLIPLVVFTVIIIALAIRAYWNGGDDSFVPSFLHAYEKKKEAENGIAVKVTIDSMLQHRIDSFVRAVPSVGSLGVMFYDAAAGQDVYTYRADELMRPASCMKLLTCVASLQKFGKSMKYRTRLYVSGKMKGDTLVGDITLKTQFDPAFNRDSLYLLTDTLAAMGIKCLRGKVMLDMSDYSSMNHEEHWTMGDLRTRYLGLCYTGGNRLRVEMQYALQRAGIVVNRDNIVYGRLDYAASRKVAEIVTPIHYALEKSLKNSSNINAESLLYPLGYTMSNKGNFRSNGIKVLRNFVTERLGMNAAAHCNIEDGCGLCPEARLTPRLLVNVLRYAWQHKYIYNEVYADLPLSGTDGTLHDRLTKPNVAGRIKAKTGTLTTSGGISTLAGYYVAGNGHLIIFAIMNNECPVMDGRWWQDKLLTKIVD